ncbi:uncharacterized protein LOC142521872 [Primulina tabacum]|uniref:uncharacterized protein LOC142521872 n=1 Tax=Primulina tabacum TaxID=48773 RepID=UPI003F59B062
MKSRNTLSIILDQNKLIGPNYNDWFLNLKIVVKSKKILNALDKNLPKETPSDVNETELAKLEKSWDYDFQAKNYILASMSNELQRRIDEMVNGADIQLQLTQL